MLSSLKWTHAVLPAWSSPSGNTGNESSVEAAVDVQSGTRSYLVPKVVHLVIIHTIFAVIKACLSAAVAALMAGVSLVITIVVLVGILAFLV